MTHKKKYAIYTAIFGEYDDLREPAFESIYNEADFYCFTDDKTLQSSKFNIIYVERKFQDATRNARYYKVMEHPVLKDYEFTIWMDALYILQVKHIVEFELDKFKQYPMTTFKHTAHNCLYDQALVCIYAYNDYYYKILGQIMRYAVKGMPVEWGLYETAILIKNHHHPKLPELQKMWWQEISRGSRRDQISLPYCAWKTGTQIGLLDATMADNRYATYTYKHRLENAKRYSTRLRMMETVERKTPYLRLWTSRLAKVIKILRALKK